MKHQSYQRADRVGGQIHQEVSKLIQFDLKDPRIGFVTVTAVEVTSDLQHAKIFYTIMGEDQDRRQTEQGLQKALGFIRRELGKRLRLRVVPEISLHYDESLAYGNKIESLLQQLKTSETDSDQDR